MTTLTLDPTATRFAVSADGTQIAYERSGAGPALVFVDGAMCFREMRVSRDMAQALAEDFTVYVYDRRDRGESGTGATPWSVQNEIDDLAAVIDAAGGRAHVFGLSSGAALALEAARQDIGIETLSVYEAPFILDDSHRPNDADLAQQMHDLVAAGRRPDAVKLFLKVVGMPAPFIGLMRVLPAWKKMVGIAHTLTYDLSIVNDKQQGQPLPEGFYDDVRVPTRVGVGGKSPQYFHGAAEQIAASVPGGTAQTLPGQNHILKPKAARAWLLG